MWCDWCGDQFDPVESTVVRKGEPVYCSWDCQGKAESDQAAYDLS